MVEEIEKHYSSTVTNHPRPQLQTPYVPPQDELQIMLCGIFQDLLGIDPIGIHDNFFELGGNSLVALQFTNRVRKVFELELPAANLFKAATVAELSEEMRSDGALDSPSGSPAIALAPIPREIHSIERVADDELVFQD
jgi:acyl carrier protein